MIKSIYKLSPKSDFDQLNKYFHYLQEFFFVALREYKQIPESKIKPNNLLPAKFMNKLFQHPLHHIFYDDTIITMASTLPFASVMDPPPMAYTGLMELPRVSIKSNLQNPDEYTGTVIECRYGDLHFEKILPAYLQFEHLSLRRIDAYDWGLLTTSPNECLDGDKYYYDPEIMLTQEEQLETAKTIIKTTFHPDIDFKISGSGTVKDPIKVFAHCSTRGFDWESTMKIKSGSITIDLVCKNRTEIEYDRSWMKNVGKKLVSSGIYNLELNLKKEYRKS